MKRIVLAGALALALSWSARAQADTPLTGAIELKLGGYKPEIDSESGLTGTPYKTSFGSKSLLLVELEMDYQLFQAFGSAAVAGSVGYGEVYGKGVFASGPQAGEVSSDSTSLQVLPLKLLGVYRFDVLARRLNIPFVPFAKAGLVLQLWRSTDGSGSVSVSYDNKHAQGYRTGFEGAVGLAFLLDWLDPALAKDFDLDLGINHSYIFAELQRDQIDGFGTPGFQFSDTMWTFGLALEY
jgi:hypothetical protein